MRRNAIKDPEYLAWIRTLPCALCGREAKGTYPDGRPRHQAAHHVTGKHNDHMTVPLCDEYLDPKSHNCHKATVHKNMRMYRPLLEPLAKALWERYQKEVA